MKKKILRVAVAVTLILYGFPPLPARAAVTINSKGPFPMILDQANTTYILSEPITVDGTAFVVGASGVTLDLSGQTVTYGNAAPITVTNGGFEKGTGRSVPGWHLDPTPECPDANAPAAAIAANPHPYYMYGNQMLKLSSFSTPQTIWSDAISIPLANREYTATIVPEGIWPSDATVELAVVDAVTMATIHTYTTDSGGVNRGYIATSRFTPTTTNPVKLKIVVTPTGTANVDLDYATLTASRDYGIVATPDYGYLPSQLQTSVITNAAAKAASFTIKNGSLIQGQGAGFSGWAMNCTEIQGITVQSMNFSVNGIDSNSFIGQWARNITIKDSTFNNNIPAITNRMHWGGVIAIEKPYGTILIDNNHIIDSPQSGISVTVNNGPITISNNVIESNTIATDGYGIGMSGVQNFSMYGNTITAGVGKSSRGIILDGCTAAVSKNGEIYNNYVDIRERGNREYGAGGLEATALRIRTFDDAGHQNIHIHDNTFIARTGATDEVHAAIGIRTGILYNAGQIDLGNVFENNIFKAIVESADTYYSAMAVSFTTIAGNSGPLFKNNVFESNHISLNFCDNDGWDVENGLFISNTIRKNTTEGATRTYKSIWAEGPTHNVRLIDMRYEGGATPTISWSGSDIKDVSTGWLVSVYAHNGTTPLSGASVDILDKGKNLLISQTTDSGGQINDLPTITTIYRQSGSDPSKITTENLNPLTVQVINGSQMMRQSLTLDRNTTLDFDFGSGIVIPVNRPPSVNAGGDQTITFPQTATLTGSASDDGLPNPPATLTATWSQVSGPATATFDNPNTPQTVAHLPAVGTYVLRLTAFDGDITSRDEVTVNAESSSPNPPPPPPTTPNPPPPPPTTPNPPGPSPKPPSPVSSDVGPERNVIHPSIGSEAIISFTCEKPEQVEISIYSRQGRVKGPIQGECVAGTNSYTWDGRNEDGGKVASGIYLVKIKLGDKLLTKKVAVLQ